MKDMILACVRWYVAYPLSYRQAEELTHMIKARQMVVDEGEVGPNTAG